MQITADDIFIPGAFVAIDHIVASAQPDSTERQRCCAQLRLAAVIFVSDNFTKLFTFDNDVADEVLGLSVGLDIQ